MLFFINWMCKERTAEFFGEIIRETSLWNFMLCGVSRVNELVHEMLSEVVEFQSVLFNQHGSPPTAAESLYEYNSLGYPRK